MRALEHWAAANGRPFPLTPAEFAPSLRTMLEEAPELRPMVGFSSDGSKVTFLRSDFRAKFGYEGTEVISLLADPNLLMAYKGEWDVWWSGLSTSVRAAHASLSGRNASTGRGFTHVSSAESGFDGNASVALPDERASVLALGHHSCPKWGVLALEVAFFNAVLRAIIATPLFSMVAICFFVKSLLVSYAALYCLMGMIVALLGCMRVFGIPLGVVEALNKK